MADENWRKVKEIFDVALRQKPELRQIYIIEACGEDKLLLTEVKSLLSSFDNAENFMEENAIAYVAEVIVGEGEKFEAGKRFGHYEIVRQIGAGGMGEVYLARDKKLERRVAIKILSEKFDKHESNLKRFTQEARAASALNHPNILIIHEISEAENVHYIVSEFVEGKTLREFIEDKTLSVAEILDIAIQIANALNVAHSAHIIHRDIKPENIIVRPDGLAKILDFGLAKLIVQKHQSLIGLEDGTLKQNETAQGIILGTVNYMSPEQAKGERIDERTDIFSFGAVIYEMVTGRTPFAGETMSETFANLIKTEPLPLARYAANVPNELQRIVSRTLKKNKDGRYQTMRDLLIDLKELCEQSLHGEKTERLALNDDNATKFLPNITADANEQNTVNTNYGFSQQIKSRIKQRPRVFLISAVFLLLIFLTSSLFYHRNSMFSNASDTNRSIAILPLKPLKTEDLDAIYELGIAETLIFKLHSANDLTVRPLSATRKYLELDQNPIDAGREQQVDFVLSSNYQIADGKIRVTSQIVNVQTGKVEEVFKSETDSVDKFSMQDAIANDIGSRLLAQLGSRENNLTAKRGTTNEEAYRLYLQATYIFEEWNEPEIGKAIKNLEQAVILDPNYAQAYARLAYAYQSYQWSWRADIASENEYYLKSKKAIEKASALDENSADTHAVSGFIKSGYERDFAGAEKEYQRAIDLNPDSGMAHGLYASYLMIPGRFDEALAEEKKAIDIDPTYVVNYIAYGMILYDARRYPEASAYFKKMLEKYGNNYFPYNWLWIVNDAQGNEPEAYEWFVKYLTQAKTDPETIRLFQTAYQQSGWKGILREKIRQDEQILITDKDPDFFYEIACFSAKLGNKEKAFEYLDKAYERRRSTLNGIKLDPSLDSLHGDPRFEQLVKHIGLS